MSRFAKHPHSEHQPKGVTVSGTASESPAEVGANSHEFGRIIIENISKIADFGPAGSVDLVCDRQATARVVPEISGRLRIGAAAPAANRRALPTNCRTSLRCTSSASDWFPTSDHESFRLQTDSTLARVISPLQTITLDCHTVL